jgi:hypothetical protein
MFCSWKKYVLTLDKYDTVYSVFVMKDVMYSTKLKIIYSYDSFINLLKNTESYLKDAYIFSYIKGT